MKTYTSYDQKTRLEKAIKSALIIANNEMNVLKQHYTEENLRYVVMSEISNVKCFGVFPNVSKDDYLLCFEKHYEKNIFKPDIVSIKFRSNGKNQKVNEKNPLVVELKINGAITNSNKNKKIKENLSKEIQQIKLMSSCLSTDIFKVRQYLRKVDNIRFEFGVVINIGIPKKMGKVLSDNDILRYINKLEETLNNHRLEFIKETNVSKNLLFAWFNPLCNKPELIWLDQPETISINKKKPKTKI